MAKFDVSGTASSVLGIAGMGIGIGILAHTAKNVMHMTDEMYRRPARQIRNTKTKYKKKTTLNIPNYWGK